MATPVVILPSRVGVPMEPNTASLPVPPNAEPMSAPLPAWSRTTAMMSMQTRTWRLTTRMNTAVCTPLRRFARRDFFAMVTKGAA